MPAKTRSKRLEAKQQIRAREEQAWQLRSQGWTQMRIAAQLQTDQATVSRDLARVSHRRLAELPEQVDQYRAEQNDILGYLLDEAVQNWEKSKTHRRRKKGATEDEYVEELRAGDPRFLETARGVLSDLRRLWGLDSAAKHLVGAVSSQDMDPAQHEDILRQLGLLPDAQEQRAPEQSAPVNGLASVATPGSATASPPEPAPMEPVIVVMPAPAPIDLASALDRLAETISPSNPEV